MRTVYQNEMKSLLLLVLDFNALQYVCFSVHEIDYRLPIRLWSSRIWFWRTWILYVIHKLHGLRIWKMIWHFDTSIEVCLTVHNLYWLSKNKCVGTVIKSTTRFGYSRELEDSLSTFAIMTFFQLSPTRSIAFFDTLILSYFLFRRVKCTFHIRWFLFSTFYTQ